MKNYKPRPLSLTNVILVTVLLLSLTIQSVQAASNAYGDGNYGACTYNDCSITLSSNGTVNLSIIPGASTLCTIQSDSVVVTTDSSTGYTLLVNTNVTNNTMQGASTGATIVSTSGTQATPLALTANRWGYRVDGVGGFGAGPTTASNNIASPPITFAAVPTSAQTGATLVNSSVPANPAVTTTVWYGLCVNSPTPADIYTATVVYTALVN